VRLHPSAHSLDYAFLEGYFGYGNTVVKVALPVVVVSALNAVLLCYLRRRRNYLFQQVKQQFTINRTIVQ
jgi:hypothetical protein